jgi:hypothetical protein
MAFASVFATNGFAGVEREARRRDASRSIDALLVDETIEMPQQVQAFIGARRQLLPIAAIRLDTAAQAVLARHLGRGRVIAGISSGATLFCLERMAWDHGFRLAGRNQIPISALGPRASQADVAAFLAFAHPTGTAGLKAVRTYRPSRTDAMLHAWVMHEYRREA